MSTKNISIGIFILVIAYICMPLFGKGFYFSHDGELHLGRIPAFSREIAQGQLPVRWTSTLNFSYGTPIFILMYPLPYYFAALPYLIGAGAIVSLKIVIAISTIAAAVFMWKFVRAWTNNPVAALIASLIYSLLPYRVFNIYTRAALGEIFIMIFPPLILLSSLMISRNKIKSGGALLAISSAGMILSHNSVSLMFATTLCVLGLLFFQSIYQRLHLLVTYILGWLLGLALSATYWLPAIIEKKYTLIDRFLPDKDVSEHFLQPLQLLITTDEALPIKMGIVSTILIVYAVLKLKKLHHRIEVIALVLVSLLAVFFSLSASRFIWESIPLLAYFQLPWRFLNLTVLGVSLLAAVVVSESKRKWLFSLILLVIALVDITQYTLSTKTQFLDSSQFDSYTGDTAWHQEGIPLWTAGSATSAPLKTIEVEGQADVTIEQQSSTKLLATINAMEESYVIFNQVYFPGWKAYVDGSEVLIEYQDINYRGLMKTAVPAGTHQLLYSFERTKVRMLADIVSAVGVVVLVCFTLWAKNPLASK